MNTAIPDLCNAGPATSRFWWRMARLRRPGAYLLFFAIVLAIMHHQMEVLPSATFAAEQPLWRFCFSPDSATIVAAAAHPDPPFSAFRVWDVERKVERFSVIGVWKGQDPVQFSPDSRMFAANATTRDIKIWNTHAGAEIATIETQQVAKAGLLDGLTKWPDFRFSPDSRFVAIDDLHKGGITLWDIERGREQGTIQGYFRQLAFSPDGNLAAIWSCEEGNCKIQVWRIHPTQQPTLEKEHLVPGSMVAFSPDLKQAVVGRPRSPVAAPDQVSPDVKTDTDVFDLWDATTEVALYDMSSGMEQWSTVLDKRGYYSLFGFSFEAGGRILMAHRGGLSLGSPARSKFSGSIMQRTETTVWDVSSAPRQIGTVENSGVVSSTGSLLVAPMGNGAKLFAASTLESIGVLVNSTDGYGSQFAPAIYSKPAFSPDGTMLAVADLAMHGQSPHLQGLIPSAVNPFAGQPSTIGVRLWDTETCQELMSFEQCTEVHFSPNGKYIATMDSAGSISLWELPLRKPLGIILIWTALIWTSGVLVLFVAIKLWRKVVAS